MEDAQKFVDRHDEKNKTAILREGWSKVDNRQAIGLAKDGRVIYSPFVKNTDNDGNVRDEG